VTPAGVRRARYVHCMRPSFLVYGANGYVGRAIARTAVATGLSPIMAGRNAPVITALARELGLEFRVFDLDDPDVIDEALSGVSVVLHCAGPFLNTSQPMVDACLRTGTHYLDITGELPVFDAVSRRDADAKAANVMLMPGAGFDVVPTDCLAMHLQQRLPSATRLTLGFQSVGPSGMPPGTQHTMIELLPFGNYARRDGVLTRMTEPMKTRTIDFGQGPVGTSQITWGDVFTAYHSTGIPTIENYVALSRGARTQMAWLDRLRPLFAFASVRNVLHKRVAAGASSAARAHTVTHVWGQAENDEGRAVAARLHGPEAGVEWTAQCAISIVKRVLRGSAPPGYQTPAMAYGPDLVLDTVGVVREEVPADPPAAPIAPNDEALVGAQRPLEVQRAEFGARRFLAMPLAGTIAWTIIGIGSLPLDTFGASMLLFVATGSIAYVGMFVSRYTGEHVIDRARQKNVFDRLFMYHVGMALLVYAIAIPFFRVNYTSLPLTVGILSGLMWLPFSWIIQHWIGVFHSVARTLLVTAAWYLAPDHRFQLIPLVIVLVYAVTMLFLEARWRQRTIVSEIIPLIDGAIAIPSLAAPVEDTVYDITLSDPAFDRRTQPRITEPLFEIALGAVTDGEDPAVLNEIAVGVPKKGRKKRLK